ncbi:MAG TPA: methyltransferase domain-containing protein [Mucilaginibacter sp.]|jgi:predicted SAM-dependent methyltransferase|nr:methyltransferase domain-containing protein [Mucilaginibacter sp.]
MKTISDMPSKLPYLNLGCGSHFNKLWVNIDFSKTGEGVIAHNLLNGIPFDDNMFEVVYHSHVLEHFPKDKAIDFILECYRVLKPGGIIRIAVPDLEQIVKNYSRLLDLGKTQPENERLRVDYDWIMIEMYDQMVRNISGGEMLKYIAKQKLDNEDFVYERIGHEGQMIREGVINSINRQAIKASSYHKIRNIISPRNYKDLFFKLFFKNEYQLIKLSRFRLSGEIHQWMYDIYSLGNLLRDVGFKKIEKKGFDHSSIPEWRSFSLDEINNEIRKPDSLFVEGIK